jgi:hypothetical protein
MRCFCHQAVPNLHLSKETSRAILLCHQLLKDTVRNIDRELDSTIGETCESLEVKRDLMGIEFLRLNTFVTIWKLDPREVFRF